MIQVAKFTRDEFLNSRWQYKAGEHVTMIAPTQHGKTTLAFQLIEQSATQKVPAVTLVMKPRDRTVTKWQKRLGHRLVRNWPPFRTPWGQVPTGYMLWPRHTFDPDQDDSVMYTQFRRCILDSYKKGNRILYGDEIYGLAQELGLTRELVAVWTRGASMGCVGFNPTASVYSVVGLQPSGTLVPRERPGYPKYQEVYGVRRREPTNYLSRGTKAKTIRVSVYTSYRTSYVYRGSVSSEDIDRCFYDGNHGKSHCQSNLHNHHGKRPYGVGIGNQ